jgi:hypothetical protein
MTNTFDLAQAFTEPAEGGLVDHPKDPGGLTNLGVSLRFLKDEGIDIDGDGVISRADIYTMTPEKAKTVFSRAFWDKLQLDLLKPRTAIAVYDSAVNTGGASCEIPSTRGQGEIGIGLSVCRIGYIPVFHSRLAGLIKLLHQFHIFQKIFVCPGQPVDHIPINIIAFTSRNQNLTVSGIVHIQLDYSDAMRREEHPQFLVRALTADFRRDQIA